MKKMEPVPITHLGYETNAQVPCTLILLEVQPSREPSKYDVYIIFRGYANLYRFKACISINNEMKCKPVSIGGYNSLAVKLSRNGHLEITSHPRNPYRVRLTFINAQGFHASVLIPKISVMPFFYEPPPKSKS